MGLLSCKVCAAKDDTIAALKDELAQAHARARKQEEVIAALADPLAHARAYRPPQKPKDETEREPSKPSPFGAMAEAPFLAPGMPGGLPKDQAALERMFAERQRNNMGVAESAKPERAS